MEVDLRSNKRFVWRYETPELRKRTRQVVDLKMRSSKDDSEGGTSEGRSRVDPGGD